MEVGGPQIPAEEAEEAIGGMPLYMQQWPKFPLFFKEKHLGFCSVVASEVVFLVDFEPNHFEVGEMPQGVREKALGRKFELPDLLFKHISYISFLRWGKTKYQSLKTIIFYSVQYVFFVHVQ